MKAYRQTHTGCLHCYTSHTLVVNKSYTLVANESYTLVANESHTHLL
jgi:hypothetical protein